MNYFKKILGILLLGSISIFSTTFSMHFNSSEHKRIELRSNSFSNNILNRLKIDLSDSFNYDQDLLNYLNANQSFYKDLFKASFNEILNYHYSNSGAWSTKTEQGQRDRDFIAGQIRDKAINDFRENIARGRLGVLIMDRNFNLFEDDVKRYALQELEKFVVIKRTWSDKARVLAGLTLLGAGSYYLVAPSVTSYVACHYYNNVYGCLNLAANYITLKDLTLPCLGLALLGKDKITSFYKYFFRNQQDIQGHKR